MLPQPHKLFFIGGFIKIGFNLLWLKPFLFTTFYYVAACHIAAFCCCKPIFMSKVFCASQPLCGWRINASSRLLSIHNFAPRGSVASAGSSLSGNCTNKFLATKKLRKNSFNRLQIFFYFKFCCALCLSQLFQIIAYRILPIVLWLFPYIYQLCNT